MRIALIGLGKMGGNMTQRLLGGGHEVVAYDRDAAAVAAAVSHGAIGASSLADVAAKLTAPRVAWVMVPAGPPTEATIDELASHFAPGDVIIDGGNSNYKDSQRRATKLAERKIGFLDAGTSGGVWGLANGYCLMVGGNDDAFAVAEPAFTTLAPPDGCRHVGPSGAGHFSKMVHNGIEYGLMQAYAEGFEILEKSGFGYDLAELARLWDKGSVVRSWLLQLLADALGKDGKLEHVKGYVEDSGEGRWTVQAAIDENVPAPVIYAALMMRQRSRQDESFAAKVNAALRNEFGGHAIKKA